MSLSRRQFLEDSMFATAAALAAPAVLRADEKQLKVKTTRSSTEQLNVAVVGVRGRGGAHIGGYLGHPETTITWICDADEDIGKSRADGVTKSQGQRPKFAKDIREVLDDPSVDIVSIATPNHWHALGAIWAIQAGKDVYVEKPVSHNVSEGRRIVEAARKFKKICQSGTQSRSNPGMRQAIEFIHAGKLGEVHLARGLCYKPRPSIGARGAYEVPKSIDYSLWSGPAPLLPLTRKELHYDWHWQWPYGNGDLGNQGIHQMDICRWGLGESTIGDSVQSYGGRFGYEDAGDTANTQVCIHGYGRKKLVFEVRGLPTGDLQGAKVGVIFYGSEGYFVSPNYNGGTAFDPDGKPIDTFNSGDDAHHYANFIAAVRSRKLEDLNGEIEEGHLSSALCHLGNISYRLGQPMNFDLKSEGSAEMEETFERFRKHLADNKVDLGSVKLIVGPVLQIDPKSETFVDNATADQMLTREYREPFFVPAQGKV